MKVTELYNEIETIQGMSLREVQDFYNVDSKMEIIALIEEGIENSEQVGCKDYNDWNEHGFVDEVDFWKFVA